MSTDTVKEQPRRDDRITLLLFAAVLLLLVDTVVFLEHLTPQQSSAGECRRLAQAGEGYQMVDSDCSHHGFASHDIDQNNHYTPLSFQPIPINHADRELLMTITGVGPRLAENILNYRQQNGPLTAAGDLTAIPGIGAKTAARLAPHFSFVNGP